MHRLDRTHICDLGHNYRSICRKLDGIALAIELAAGRASAYGIRKVATLLDHRFGLLWGGRRTALPRHRTLTATLDWSYDLLQELERTILRRLSVFAAAFTLEAARSVAGESDIDDTPVISAMDGLVTKSLMAADTSDATTHFRLLDTTRAYALQKLVESGETDRIACRHAVYYREFLNRIGTKTLGSDNAELDRTGDVTEVSIETQGRAMGRAVRVDGTRAIEGPLQQVHRRSPIDGWQRDPHDVPVAEVPRWMPLRCDHRASIHA